MQLSRVPKNARRLPPFIMSYERTVWCNDGIATIYIDYAMNTPFLLIDIHSAMLPSVAKELYWRLARIQRQLEEAGYPAVFTYANKKNTLAQKLASMYGFKKTCDVDGHIVYTQTTRI